jgi:hypothetical protein
MKVKDKLKFEFNPLTQELDLVSEFNSNRIVTHNRNAAGQLLMTFNVASGGFIAASPEVVIDSSGHVVVI